MLHLLLDAKGWRARGTRLRSFDSGCNNGPSQERQSWHPWGLRVHGEGLVCLLKNVWYLLSHPVAGFWPLAACSRVHSTEVYAPGFRPYHPPGMRSATLRYSLDQLCADTLADVRAISA